MPARSQAIIRDLIETRDGATYFAERVWGRSLRYDLGGEHPLVGRSSPDLRLQDGTRLGDLMRDGQGIVLDFSVDRRLHGSAMRWESRIRYAAGPARNDLGSGRRARPAGRRRRLGRRSPPRP